MEANAQKQRDYRVELMRIIGCLIVIGVHTLPSAMISEGEYSKSLVLLSCFFGDGVAVFWIICGFYLFRNYNYKKILKRTIGKILLPYLLCEVFIFYFYDAIVGKAMIMDSLAHSAEEYYKVLHNAISLRVLTDHAVHFWYIIAYMILVVCSPILNEFVKAIGKSSLSMKRYCIIAAIFLLINDASSNKALAFSHQGAGAFAAASILVIFGHIIYNHRTLFSQKWWLLISPILFIGLNLLRMLIQLRRYSVDPNNKSILFWYSLFGLACTLLIAAFCFSCSNAKTGLQKIILHLGSYTFPIYMVHLLVRDCLSARGVLSHTRRLIVGQGNGTIWTNTVYSLTVIVIVFTISLCICFWGNLLKKAIKSVLIRA